MQGQLKILDEQLLRDCVELGGSVALVRVREAKASYTGTRGARVRIEFEVERVLRGSVPRQSGFWSWGGPGTVAVGQRLVVALKPAPTDAKDVGLLDFVPVSDDQVEDVVRAHQQALVRLGN